MSDAPPPPSPRVDAARPTSAEAREARVLMRRLHEASGRVEAVIDQLGDIAALVRGEAPAARRPAAQETPGLRRSTRAAGPAPHDGDRRA